MRLWLAICYFLILCGCGAPFEQEPSFPIEVDSQNTKVLGGLCQIQASLSNLSRAHGYHLIWAAINLEDQVGKRYSAVFDSEALQDIVSPAFVSALGRVELSMAIEIGPQPASSEGLNGSIQVMGSHLRKLAVFQGPVQCD